MWKNKKYGKKLFKGKYVEDKFYERTFVLTHENRNITFESHQAAKALGWQKVK